MRDSAQDDCLSAGLNRKEKVMKYKPLLTDIAITAPITFVVAAAVTYLYSLIVHGSGVIDWETAFYLAFVVGLVVPLTRSFEGGAATKAV